MFFLRARRGERYGGDTRVLRPGHPIYERIKAEVLEDARTAARRSKKDVLASLNAKLDKMRERKEAAERLLAGNAEGDAAAEA